MKSALILSCSLLLFACNGNSSEPDNLLTKEQQRQLIEQSVRYSAKLPPQATHQNKFDTSFNWYYRKAALEYDLRALKADKEGGYYFLMTRKARSIWPAREAIGGTVKLDNNNKLTDYYEEFRTWKMAEDSLKPRSMELFDLMTQGKPLTFYRSKYKGDKYIEFPDDNNYFSKEEKRWKNKAMDSINMSN